VASGNFLGALSLVALAQRVGVLLDHSLK